MKHTIIFILILFFTAVSCEKAMPKMAVTCEPVDANVEQPEETQKPLKKHDRW